MKSSSTALAVAALSLAALAGPAIAEPKFVEKQAAGEWLAHRLVGTKVLNAQAEQIGEVKDVVVDGKGQVTAVVLGVGGMLGFPEKLVAVPYSALQIGEVVQSSRIVVLPDANKDLLRAAPVFTPSDPGTTERVAQRASDWYAAAKSKVLELTKTASEKAKELTTPAPAPTPKQ
jgi:sporulation protein YlmC with PRC-barrel domain